MHSIKLSVCIPTYNHASFIAQCLDGILMQDTDFAYELVIGDDGSNDDAPRIIQQYAQKFPDKIRAFLHPENLGPNKHPELGGKNNVMFLFSQCRGKYIALCEGDDYWTDRNKLQKQVDFLEENANCALCHHQVTVEYEDGSPSHLFNPDNQKATSSIEDLLSDRWFVATTSSVFRNIHHPFPAWFLDAASGDLGIFIMAARHGKIHYFPECMGVYRKHKGGMMNIHTQQNRFYIENRKAMFEAINEYYQSDYQSVVNNTIQKYSVILADLSQ